MATCKGCGQTIKWIRLNNGKAMPVNPEPVYYEDRREGAAVIITEDGRVSSGHTEAVAVVGSKVRGYVSHFATCPMADRFRREARSR